MYRRKWERRWRLKRVMKKLFETGKAIDVGKKKVMKKEERVT